MRISIKQTAKQLTLKVEGRIVGDLAAELDRFWQSLAPTLAGKKLRLDICDVAYADKGGKHILRKIFAATDAEILANSPLTKQFADEVRQQLRMTGEETQHA